MTLLSGKSRSHSNVASGIRAVASLEVLKATVVLLAGFGLLTLMDLTNIRSPGMKGKERLFEEQTRKGQNQSKDGGRPADHAEAPS
jgi:hypothetical protein